MTYEQLEFQKMSDLMGDFIEKMEEELDSYSKSEGAKKGYIKKINYQIKFIVNFHNSATHLFNILLKDHNDLSKVKADMARLEYRYRQLQILARDRGVDFSLIGFVKPDKDERFMIWNY